jgi:hypothetical protein
VSKAGWRVPINVKLLAVLAVPVLGYLIIATTLVARAQQTADEIRDQASVVETAVGPTSLSTSLIDERTITSLEGAGLQDQLALRIGTSEEARQATDEQLTALRSLVDDNGEADEVYASAVDKIAGELDTLRADVDSGTADEASLFNRYGGLINALMDANAKAVERVDQAELWQGAKLSELATRQKDARAILINALIPVAQNEGAAITPRQTTAIGRSLGAYENRDAAIRELATGPYARAGSVLVEATEARDIGQLARDTLADGELDAETFFQTASYQGGFVYDLPTGDFIHDNFRASVVEYLTGRADERTAAADQGLRNHLIGGTIGLIVTALITWLVSRSIIRPLRSLTQQAIDAATNRLPSTVYDILETPLGEDVAWPQVEPIEVRTNDEVADVAQALNTMQESALELAVEEAILRRHITDSLITLGQRNQRLLSRQLAFITDLERDETDPDTLADLFFLDHLAIRMRRNAESLLVLAGFDPPRKWVGPTSVNDIVRAALGETEEYKRVWVQGVEPAIVAGSATAELSHLLAELIENALVFSTRGESVEVNGWHETAGDGTADGYTLTVADSGKGMSPDEIEQANRRLAGVESFTIAPSKYMGHYVTGKLAARHGISVQLASNAPNKGVTATIYVPNALLTAESEAPDVPRLLPTLPVHAPPEAAGGAGSRRPGEPDIEAPAVAIGGSALSPSASSPPPPPPPPVPGAEGEPGDIPAPLPLGMPVPELPEPLPTAELAALDRPVPDQPRPERPRRDRSLADMRPDGPIFDLPEMPGRPDLADQPEHRDRSLRAERLDRAQRGEGTPGDIPLPTPAPPSDPPVLFPLPSPGELEQTPPEGVSRKARKRKARPSSSFKLPVPPPSKPLEAPDSDVS